MSTERRDKLTITVDVSTSKLQMKLKAIAKHAGALADELDDIDNACECGSMEFTELYAEGKPYVKVCDGCGTEYFADEDEADKKKK